MNICQKERIFCFHSCDYNTFSFYILRMWWVSKNGSMQKIDGNRHTFGLEVQRAILCAKGTLRKFWEIKKALLLIFNINTFLNLHIIWQWITNFDVWKLIQDNNIVDGILLKVVYSWTRNCHVSVNFIYFYALDSYLFRINKNTDTHTHILNILRENENTYEALK